MIQVRRFLPVLIALSLLAAAGCAKSSIAGGKNSPSSSPSAKTLQKDPAAQLTFATYLPLADFKKQIQDPIAAKYPNIKLTYQWVRQSSDLVKLVNEGKTPDIILDEDRFFIDFAGYRTLDFDLNPLAKESRLDFSSLNPDVLKRMQQYGQKGELYSLPYTQLSSSLFYNKTVFDQFDIEYPKDNMSWNQVMDLSKKFNQPLNGITYRGFEPLGIGFSHNSILDQHSLQFLDPKTNQPNVTTPAWKEAVALIRNIYAASPVSPEEYSRKDFIQNKTAMTLGPDLDLLIDAAKNKSNVDMVSYPTDPNLPGIGSGTRITTLSITPACKDKKAAFQVLLYLISEPAQTAAARNGKVPILNTKELNSILAQDVPPAKGKNVAAVFLNKMAPPPAGGFSQYENFMFPNFNGLYLRKIALDSGDIDVLLNEIQEGLKPNVDHIKIKVAEAAAAISTAPSISGSAQPTK